MENLPNTTNVPKWARSWCCGGLNVWLEGGWRLREGTAGGTAGEVLAFIYNVITKKNEPFVRMGMTAHPHPRCCCALRVGREKIPPNAARHETASPQRHGFVLGIARLPNTKNVPAMARFSWSANQGRARGCRKGSGETAGEEGVYVSTSTCH